MLNYLKVRKLEARSMRYVNILYKKTILLLLTFLPLASLLLTIHREQSVEFGIYHISKVLESVNVILKLHRIAIDND